MRFFSEIWSDFKFSDLAHCEISYDSHQANFFCCSNYTEVILVEVEHMVTPWMPIEDQQESIKL